jgi:hypothetical protein
MLVIPVNKVADPKKHNRKMEGQGGGKVQEVADPKNKQKKVRAFSYTPEKLRQIRSEKNVFVFLPREENLPTSAMMNQNGFDGFGWRRVNSSTNISSTVGPT